MPRKKIYVKLQHTHKKCSKRLVANAKSCNKWKRREKTQAKQVGTERERGSWKSCKWRKWKVASGECKVYVNITAQIENQCVSEFSVSHKFAISHLSVASFALFVWEFLLERTQKSMQGLIGLKCQAAAGTKAHNFNQNNCPLAVKLHQATSLPLHLFLPLYPSPSLCLSPALRVAYIVKFQFAYEYHKKMSIPQQIRLSAACNDKNATTTTTTLETTTSHGVGDVARIKS